MQTIHSTVSLKGQIGHTGIFSHYWRKWIDLTGIHCIGHVIHLSWEGRDILGPYHSFQFGMPCFYTSIPPPLYHESEQISVCLLLPTIQWNGMHSKWYIGRKVTAPAELCGVPGQNLATPHLMRSESDATGLGLF